MPYEFLDEFREIGTHSRTRDGCQVSTFGSECDNFIGIKVVDFLNFLSIFTSPVDIDCIPVIVYLIFGIKYMSFMKTKKFHHDKEVTTTKGTCRRGDCLGTTRSCSTGRTPGTYLGIWTIRCTLDEYI